MPVNETAMKEMGFSVARKYIGPQSNTNEDLLDQYNEALRKGHVPQYFELPSTQRKLKGEYTIEMMQDLKAMMGIDAEKELISLMAQDLAENLDDKLISQLTRVTQ